MKKYLPLVIVLLSPFIIKGTALARDEPSACTGADCTAAATLAATDAATADTVVAADAAVAEIGPAPVTAQVAPVVVAQPVTLAEVKTAEAAPDTGKRDTAIVILVALVIIGILVYRNRAAVKAKAIEAEEAAAAQVVKLKADAEAVAAKIKADAEKAADALKARAEKLETATKLLTNADARLFDLAAAKKLVSEVENELVSLGSSASADEKAALAKVKALFPKV
jgi:hypothetical protein